MFSGRIVPKMRAMPSSRPIWIRRQERGAQSQPLEAVADQESELGLVRPPDLAQPADAQDLVVAGRGFVAFGDQRHLAVVVDEADPGQALVGDARAQLHRVEVAERDACVRRACRGTRPAAARPRDGSAGCSSVVPSLAVQGLMYWVG